MYSQLGYNGRTVIQGENRRSIFTEIGLACYENFDCYTFFNHVAHNLHLLHFPSSVPLKDIGLNNETTLFAAILTSTMQPSTFKILCTGGLSLHKFLFSLRFNALP